MRTLFSIYCSHYDTLSDQAGKCAQILVKILFAIILLGSLLISSQFFFIENWHIIIKIILVVVSSVVIFYASYIVLGLLLAICALAGPVVGCFICVVSSILTFIFNAEARRIHSPRFIPTIQPKASRMKSLDEICTSIRNGEIKIQ